MPRLASLAARAAILAVLCLPLSASSAAASPIIECGGKPAGGSWTFGEFVGAGTWNLTARRVGCTTARRIADRVFPGKRYQGWRCRYVSQAHEYADVRCTKAGGRVVRYQTGA